jgi:hypothetical protein
MQAFLVRCQLPMSEATRQPATETVTAATLDIALCSHSFEADEHTSFKQGHTVLFHAR